MVTGCMNPHAVNYNEDATEDDGSCIYLVELDGQCLEFRDADLSDSGGSSVTSSEEGDGDTIDKSFTLSFDIIDKKWAFLHDYFPDYYFHTRKHLYNIKTNTIYEHNAGRRGLFHNRSEAHPFFIDVLFTGKETLTLNAVKWISEVRAGGNEEADENMPALYSKTISAITIWNNYMCSGRIVLDTNNLALLNQNNRNSEQQWSLNDFRNIAKEDVQFLDTLFNDFRVIDEMVDTALPWYEKRLIDGKYFIVRFEFENEDDQQITLHDVDIDTDISIRA